MIRTPSAYNVSGCGGNKSRGAAHFLMPGAAGQMGASGYLYDHDFVAGGYSSGTLITATTPDVAPAGSVYESVSTDPVLYANASSQMGGGGSATRARIDMQAGDWIGEFNGNTSGTGHTSIGKLDYTDLASKVYNGVWCLCQPQVGLWKINTYAATVATLRDSVSTSGNGPLDHYYAVFNGASVTVNRGDTKAAILSFGALSAADQAETGLLMVVRRSTDYYSRMTVHNETDISKV